MSFQPLMADKVEHLLAQPCCIVLDHRDPVSYNKAHLPGAKPVSDPLLSAMLRGNKQNPVLVYCYHGNSSKDLASLLVNFGFQNVYNLEGGWKAWETYTAGKRPALSDTLQSWLTEQGFDPCRLNGRIQNGMTAVMQAGLHARTDILQALLDAGDDIQLLNDDYNNALWFACFSADLATIDLLIRRGIDINNRNVNGATALIYAASAGKFHVVKALAEAGARLDPVTLDGFSALDSASTIEVLRYLKQHTRNVTSSHRT